MNWVFAALIAEQTGCEFMRKHTVVRELAGDSQYRSKVHPTLEYHTQCSIDEIQKHEEEAESKAWLQWEAAVENTIFRIRGS